MIGFALYLTSSLQIPHMPTYFKWLWCQGLQLQRWTKLKKLWTTKIGTKLLIHALSNRKFWLSTQTSWWFSIGLCQQHMKDKKPKTFHLSRSLKPFLDIEFYMTLWKMLKTSRFKATTHGQPPPISHHLLTHHPSLNMADL